MAKKYGVASDYIKYTSRIKSDTSDGVAVEASQVVDLEQDKLQSEINKELKASITAASGNTYSKSEIDSKDSATLTSAKSYADTKKTEAVSAAATDATTKANSALASAKSYADEKVSALGSVYTTKGSCTAAQLKALTSAKAGDVWNITDAITIDGKAYPAGVNVVCVTAFSAAIDPATTKNWDALQGLQDLTSYAKKSEIEDVAVANVKFAQSEIAQENSISFDKTITYVNGREATTVDDLAILPATSTKAGVMSAADKVKLDAVDGTIEDGIKVGINSGRYYIVNPENNLTFGTSIIGVKTLIGRDVSIRDSASIGLSATIGDYVLVGPKTEIQGGVFIGTNTMNDGIQINADVRHATIGDVVIKSNIVLGEEGGQQQLSGVAFGTIIGFGMDSSGNFIWENNGPKKTAATTDDISGLTSNISALTSRVSALEDLLKLA